MKLDWTGVLVITLLSSRAFLALLYDCGKEEEKKKGKYSRSTPHKV
jgi:hypothetical protein